MTETPFQILKLTDGTADSSGVPHEIDLLSDGSGFCLQSWDPSITEPKGGGVWADSQLADGRQLRVRHVQNVSESMIIDIHGGDADMLARKTQTLRRLLVQASYFGTTSWSRVPVWIEARAVNETNSRYALVRDWRTPQDSDHYGPLFWQKIARADMADFDLILEREPYWRDTEPGDSTCLPISGNQLTTQAYSLLYYSGDSEVEITGAPAILADLPAADFTVEAWIKATDWGGLDLGGILFEGSWYFNLNVGTGLFVGTDYTVTDPIARGTFTPDSIWHHVAAVWDQSGDEWTLYVDGLDAVSSRTAAAGIYTNASAGNVFIGNTGIGTRNFEGEIGWVRISDNTRWTADFTDSVPEQCQLPLDDANTLWLGLFWPTATASVVTDESGNGNNGTAAATTWTVACQERKGNYLPCSPSYMTFNGTTSTALLGSPADLDNLPSSTDFTVDAWILSNGYGAGNAGRIIDKGDWYARLDNGSGLNVFCNFDVTDALSRSTLADYSADSEWHHVAFVWNIAAKTWRIWIDGTEATYTEQIVGATNYVADAPDNANLGNNNAQTRGFDGDIQWVRIRDVEVWTADFDDDIPERCAIPATDADTLGIWSPVSETDIRDFSWNGNDGTGDTLALGCDCVTAGTEETCAANTVFLTNHHKAAGLTYVWYYDDNLATYSTNRLFQALPYPLLPDTPAVSDCLYLGIDDSMTGDYGPFASAVFDLNPVQTGIVSMDWEYYDGAAWAAFATLQDNTSITATFDNSGIGSVHWQQPDDWDTTTINGIVGYWARAIVTSISGTPTPPAQQNRHAYTISWPYIEVDDLNVGGDVTALARDQLTGYGFGADQLVMGLRSISRGSDFTAFLNLSDYQQPSWHSVGFGVVGTLVFQDDSEAPTGRSVLFNPAGNGTNDLSSIIGSGATLDFFGRYHAYVRVKQTGGVAGDMSAYLTTGFGSAATRVQYDTVYTATVGALELLDLGAVTLPASEFPYAVDAFAIYNRLFLENTGGAGVTLTLIDLIIIPTDEWSIDTSGSFTTDETAYVDVDSAVQLKRSTTSTFWGDTTGLGIPGTFQFERWQANTGGPFFLQANQDQRLWVLSLDGDVPEPEIAHASQMWRTQRYYSMRGDR